MEIINKKKKSNIKDVRKEIKEIDKIIKEIKLKMKIISSILKK